MEIAWLERLGVVALAALAAACAGAAEDILVADFEGEDYAGWAAEGEAFGEGPARGSADGQMEVAGFEGEGLVNSFHGKDGSTGLLTSPPITLSRPYMNFLIGGGFHADDTCMNLVVAGRPVRTSEGAGGAVLRARKGDVEKELAKDRKARERRRKRAQAKKRTVKKG